MIPDTNTVDAMGIAQTFITNNMQVIVLICSILFLALIVSILLKLLNKDFNETIEVDHDELFSDEI